MPVVAIEEREGVVTDLQARGRRTKPNLPAREASMNARRWIISSIVVASVGAGAAYWLIGTAHNPVREAMQVGVMASGERLPERVGGAAQAPLDLFAASLIEPVPSSTAVKGRLYVPAYAHIRLGSGRGKLDLATTLSIHNSDGGHPVVLRKVSYHGTDGRLVDALIDRPVAIKPLATIEFFVPADDLRAGSGANFVIEWGAAAEASEPVAEAVMIGAIGTTSYSFVSRGQATKTASGE